MSDNQHWVGTWTTAPAPAESGAFSNQTLRMTMRASLGGDTVRVRVSNAYGHRPLNVGNAYIAVRNGGPAIIAGSERKLSFGGENTVTIAAGAVVFSDPAALSVAPLADLAVSLYLPGEIPNDFQITGRYARQTNYVSPPGDFAAAEVMPIASLTSDWFFVCGVDVIASPDDGGIVALGDSLTDGNISTMDAFCRWPDQLARRLTARHRGRPMAVMNQGLGGNRILFDIRGGSGLRRFDRDVLSQPGVTHVIVMLGTNDIRNRWKKPEEEPTAAQMIAGLKQMAVRAHSRGIKIIGATLTPFGNETYMANAWNPKREEVRSAVNSWVREGGAFEAVADFDKALRDPERPTQMLTKYDCGDGLHPSDLGYNKMGDAIDLSLFD
ncbi:MAG TPA: SGNH/GDSL hydrolase family protein [Stellaceae bacterium]|nr:SGNH/GDSL hydrolase family protein [Stellaceae bacterium]